MSLSELLNSNPERENMNIAYVREIHRDDWRNIDSPSYDKVIDDSCSFLVQLLRIARLSNCVAFNPGEDEHGYDRLYHAAARRLANITGEAWDDSSMGIFFLLEHVARAYKNLMSPAITPAGTRATVSRRLVSNGIGIIFLGPSFDYQLAIDRYVENGHLPEIEMAWL